MKILAMDTSAKTTSVCIAENDTILAEFSILTSLTHSQTLMPMMQAASEACGVALDAIDLFAVSNGPGSFTGLRIGIGAVKGMAMGANKPCIGISTLEALAQNLTDVPGVICAAMDARCNQVYTASFTVKNGVICRLTEDNACMIGELKKMLCSYNEPITFVGDGAELCCKAMKDALDVRLASPVNRRQRASGVALCAYRCAEQAVSAAALSPTYLRRPQAERERLAKQQNSEEKSNG